MIVLALANLARGQNEADSLVFIYISDKQGVGISQAKIEFKSDSVTQTVETGRDGKTHLNLSPGRYVVMVDKPGFTLAKVTNFIVRDRVPAILNLTLRPGEPPIVEPAAGQPQVPTQPSALPTDVIRTTPVSPIQEQITLPLPSLPVLPWPSEVGWTPVMRLCGRLTTESNHGTMEIAPNEELTLYEAKWRASCCKDLKLAGREVTGVHGYFDFGPLKSGRYWLALEWGGQDYAFPLDIDPGHKWFGSCDVQGPFIGKQYSQWAVWTQARM